MENLRPSEFVDLLLRTGPEGISVTLEELANSLRLKESMHDFDKFDEIAKALQQHKLELIPPIMHGNKTTERVLRPTETQTIDEDKIRSLCKRREDFEVELKSSLYYHYQRAAAGNFENYDDLKSADVTYSSLKSICAFLNSSGGKLLIGVDDSGKILGLKEDCKFFNRKTIDLDKWELSLRNLIIEKFKDGRSVANFVHRRIVETSEGAVCLLTVAAREKVSFLKKADGSFAVYTRKGNNSEEVKIDEFEDFLASR